MYPRTSRAAVLSEYGQPLEVQELTVPELEPRSILVRVEASTMCGTDVHMSDGDYAEAGISQLPIIMGHEIVGRVVAIGAGGATDALSRSVVEGDLIAWAYGWCDRCYWCTIAKQPTLCANRRYYGWGPADQFPYLTGGYAEYCYVLPICKPIKVPDGVDPRVAASATCAFRTIMHAYEAVSRIKSTDTLVIQGTGPVGLFALAYALQAGAAQTICIGAPEDRLAIARDWGATRVIDVLGTLEEERREIVHGMTDGRGADLVVECSGVAAAFEEGMDLVRRGGEYLIVGQAEGRPSRIPGTYINLRQLRIAGTVSGDVSHYYRAFEFMAEHGDRFDFSRLLGNSYGLGDVNEAIASMRAAREPKPVILPLAA